VNIIKVEITQDDIKHSMPISVYHEALVAELSSVAFQSRLFSVKGIVSQAELQRQISIASDKVIQSIRDFHG
jgi:hypothetical protein